MRTKEELLKSTKEHEQNIKKELNNLSVHATNYVQKLTVIGGVVFMSYAFYKIFFGEEKNKKSKSGKAVSNHAKPRNSVIGRISRAMALLILNESKGKLQSILEETEENGHTE